MTRSIQAESKGESDTNAEYFRSAGKATPTSTENCKLLETVILKMFNPPGLSHLQEPGMMIDEDSGFVTIEVLPMFKPIDKEIVNCDIKTKKTNISEEMAIEDISGDDLTIVMICSYILVFICFCYL